MREPEQELAELIDALPQVSNAVRHAFRWRDPPITTMQQLTALTGRELMWMPGIGSRTVTAIEHALERRGLSLGMGSMHSPSRWWDDVLGEIT